MSSVQIACLQTRPRATFQEALDEALPLAEQAAADGARMLFLPEYCGGLASDGTRFCPPAAAEAEHPVLSALRETAKSLGVWMQVGSIAISGPGEKIINRGFVLDDQGDVQSRYDKIHLFDVTLSETATYRESETVAPGAEACLVETPLGMLGHTICYDLRFPQLYRSLAQSGAHVLTCPAAFTKTTGEAHWHILNRARAIENGAFMVSACAVGEVPGGGACYGHSLVVAPWGEVLADGGAEAGVVMATLDLGAVAEARAKVPSLTHDRDFALPHAQRSAAE